MDLYFTNFTRFCVNDTWPANAMIRSAAGGPTPWLLPAGAGPKPRTLAARERLATSSADVAALLRDPTIAGVRLVSNVQVQSCSGSQKPLAVCPLLHGKAYGRDVAVAKKGIGST